MRASTTSTKISARGCRKHCPKGIDVYFDNVGGEILDTAWPAWRETPASSFAARYRSITAPAPVKGPKNYLSLLVNRARMEGFVVFDYAERYGEGEGHGRLAAGGKLKSREDIVDGIETFPETLLKLFTGENFGKLVLQVADP